MVVLPYICDPAYVQPTEPLKVVYEHVSGMELTDSGDVTGILEIDLLIRLDHYWKLVTSKIVKGTSRPRSDLGGCCQDLWRVCKRTQRSTSSLHTPATFDSGLHN